MPDPILLLAALLAVALMLALTVVSAVTIVRWGRERRLRATITRAGKRDRGALSKRLRAGDAPLLCDSRSDSGSCCDRPHGHTGLHGCVEIMRDKGRTWPCAVYWTDRPFRVEALPELPERPPRALDPVTVTDGRVERVKGGAATTTQRESAGGE